MKLHSWRRVSHVQWKGVEGIQVKQSDGAFYVDVGKLSEREGIKGNGYRLREWRGAWLQMGCWVSNEECVCPLQRKEPS